MCEDACLGESPQNTSTPYADSTKRPTKVYLMVCGEGYRMQFTHLATVIQYMQLYIKEVRNMDCGAGSIPIQ